MRVKRHYSGGDPGGDAAEPGLEVQKIDLPTVEKKLSIVEKALESNPDCEELLQRRCRYAQIVLPDEKVSFQRLFNLSTSLKDTVPPRVM